MRPCKAKALRAHRITMELTEYVLGLFSTFRPSLSSTFSILKSLGAHAP